MRRQDVEAGVAYGYATSREYHSYTTYHPMIILSTDKYRAKDGRLEAAPDAPMASGSWRKASVGMPAVNVVPYQLREGETIESRIARVRELASLAKYSWQGDITDDDGTRLATYQLVTSSMFLHGAYTDLVERQRQEGEARNETARQNKERQDRNTADYFALRARAATAGLDLPQYYDDYRAPRSVTLTFEQLSALLDRAKGEDQ